MFLSHILNFTFTLLQIESVFGDQDYFSFAKDRFSISYFIPGRLQSLQWEVQKHHSDLKRGYQMKGVLCMLLQYCCIKVLHCSEISDKEVLYHHSHLSVHFRTTSSGFFIDAVTQLNLLFIILFFRLPTGNMGKQNYRMC